MFDGYHTAQFERAAAKKAEATAQKESRSENATSGSDQSDSENGVTDDSDGTEDFESPQVETTAKRPRPKRKPKTASTLPS